MLLENWKRNPCIIYYVIDGMKKDDVLFVKIEVDFFFRTTCVGVVCFHW